MAAVDASKYDPGKYAHSPAHAAVLSRNHEALRHLVALLPSLGPPFSVVTEADSVAEEAKADAISAVLDRRDVPGQETALHLAVHIADPVAADILLAAGANWKIRNAGGWDALQEAICAGEAEIARVIVRRRRAISWARYCRRLPRVVATMRQMRDFYMEITFHFESSVMPFVSRIAPSDTYRIWKRGADLRADMTLAGFDGLRIQRSGQTLLFLGEGSEDGKIAPGAICSISHEHKEVVNTMKAVASDITPKEVEREVSDLFKAKICRPGIDVNRAVLVPQLNWRRNEKTETVGSWKTKVYDMHHVVVSLRSRQVAGSTTKDDNCGSPCFENDSAESFDDILTEKEMQQLEAAAVNQDGSDLDCGDDAHRQRHQKQNQRTNRANSSSDANRRRRGSTRNNHDTRKASRKDTVRGDDTTKDGRTRKAPLSGSPTGHCQNDLSKQGEYKKTLRPTLWLSPDFPLSIEELLPLLDILGSKVKAVQRLRDTFSTKLPSGEFPVKVAIPVVPMVRVVVTFTKFEELRGEEEEPEFSTPPSSPDRKSSKAHASSGSSWFRWVKEKVPYTHRSYVPLRERSLEDLRRTFMIPEGYTWLTLAERKKRAQKRKVMSNRRRKAQSSSGSKISK